MKYADNPDYEPIFTAFKGTEDEVIFYAPKDKLNGYHLSRKIAFETTDAYSRAGISAEALAQLVKKGKEVIFGNNVQYSKKLDAANAILDEIQYRLTYPKDEEIALKKASYFLLIDGEDPNRISDTFTKKKLEIAYDCPDTYAFFLAICEQSQSYSNLSPESLLDEDYLRTRAEIIRKTRQKLL